MLKPNWNCTLGETQLKFLSQAQRDEIADLTAQGRTTDAVNVALVALKTREDEARTAGVGLATGFGPIANGLGIIVDKAGAAASRLDILGSVMRGVINAIPGLNAALTYAPYLRAD